VAGALNIKKAERQLAAIGSLSHALDASGVDYWLFGGWAVDFWVGSITRDHDDIDVAAWRSDQDLINAALVGAGWRHTPADDEVVGTRYQLHDAQAEFTFVVSDAEGRVLIPFEQPLVWAVVPFGSNRRELLGVRSRTIPFALLKAGKQQFAGGMGRVQDAKDRADLEALMRVENAG
jgi:Aminoglycoside-2''-adenylyltransferase